MSEIIGKYYTWREYTIYFDINGLVSAPWRMGTYEWLDHRQMKIVWAGIVSIVIFNPTRTAFSAISQQTGEIVNGTLVEFAKDSKIPSIKIDYKDLSGTLCFMSKKYNVDKSSQRENPGPMDSNHCHPYSLLYDFLFKAARHTPLTICEIGIAEGRSLLTWEEYFPKSSIYGFDYLPKFVDGWNETYPDKKSIHVDYMDVRYPLKIVDSLKNTNTMFDFIIDDSSHLFFDIIRIIKNSHQFLKPGGMMIIEDIRNSFDESWFYNELKEILPIFQLAYFVSLDHNRRNSGIVRNDKVLILIKEGPRIFNSVL